jgi:glycosyltransferase involved in cell wall biosynthesis
MLHTEAPTLTPRNVDRFVLFLGRIAAGKGLDVLIDAFAGVSEANPNVSLVIAGPDTDRLLPSLLTRARQRGISNRIAYVGTVTGPGKFRLLADAEAYVLPSVEEGLSITVLEALACGCPVVISPACNMPCVAESGAGIVVEPEEEHIARALQDILGNEALRKSMSKSARALAVRRFSIDTVARQMVALYAEVAPNSRFNGCPP